MWNIFIALIMIFITIYLSVKLAIRPLLNKSDVATVNDQESELIKLRDMEIISNIELEDLINFYKKEDEKRDNYIQYKKYEKILEELRNIKYLKDEEYFIKINKLKSYFNIGCK
ncbi:hypothetical protein Curi_c20400 [Gottschalkia acidurici 9a]|uniref:Uncharacterized protein n=1 Tax=Gottschalkia acidurici (strain ATCC 7906 / DSM 604 / BCRC 14475 / CIP 104303 / KCTC 5404 / NCIMB 10678 / 9a) TaxID=1128398 RepID=K0B0I3_GOTA9|nr:hypothetical protein [Gottschalkia acidurici]AFS79044.1 hypothetical protein Curi_c20400 [Gottschalkia acidurici 9a]